MGLFNDMKTEGLEETQDRLGGFSPFETDIYEAEIKVAYAGQSAAGARNVTLVADIGGREYRETIYLTNRQGENFYLNKNDKTKKVPLPGFTTMNDICLVASDKPISDQDTEEKVVNVYDADAKKELPKSVQVLTELTGKQVYLGITNALVNKNEKDGNGQYVATAETRNENTIDKVFHYPTKMTVAEARDGKTEPGFFDAWAKKNAGQVRDRRTVKDGQAGSNGKPSAGPPAAGSATPRKSLFNS